MIFILKYSKTTNYFHFFIISILATNMHFNLVSVELYQISDKSRILKCNLLEGGAY